MKRGRYKRTKECACGNAATVFHCSAWKCKRCRQLEQIGLNSPRASAVEAGAGLMAKRAARQIKIFGGMSAP